MVKVMLMIKKYETQKETAYSCSPHTCYIGTFVND